MKLRTTDNFEKNIIGALESTNDPNLKAELRSLLVDYAFYRSIGGKSIE